MPFFVRKPLSVEERLSILSQDSCYDLACACATKADEHRRRGRDQRWVYPVVLPGRRPTFLFKTLLSNECSGSCGYCPLRARSNARRVSLSPEELVRAFLSYHEAGRVEGLFLSSGVAADPDGAMERINRAALLLRRQGFRGYIHLKVIPGASPDAVRQAVALASAVSLNVESPGEENFRRLRTAKDYRRDIVGTINLISRLTGAGTRRERVKQTTQFVVGASSETDREIIGCSSTLYRKLALSRVYFSAYQRGQGSPDLPGEQSKMGDGDLLTREHRLYQADWLMRKYGFEAAEIPLDAGGNLSLAIDPKEAWALAHPEFFPVDVNRDDRHRLLRVPGLGLVAVARILDLRRKGRLMSFGDLGRQTKALKEAEGYAVF